MTEKLDRGLLDFAVIVEPPDLSKYNYLTLPEPDTWGVLMRKDSPLCFRPIEPPLETRMYVIWKKYQVFTPIAELLLQQLKASLATK